MPKAYTSPHHYISIHAPTRGATGLDGEKSQLFFISIHAPTRGATQYTYIICKQYGVISIHAPTRGATLEAANLKRQGVFQSTLPREERRYTRPFFLSLYNISIHAPTRGATCFKHFGGLIEKNFNPRSHERSDYFLSNKNVYGYISIHAPTRGATSCIDNYMSL